MTGECFEYRLKSYPVHKTRTRHFRLLYMHVFYIFVCIYVLRVILDAYTCVYNIYVLCVNENMLFVYSKEREGHGKNTITKDTGVIRNIDRWRPSTLQFVFCGCCVFISRVPMQ
jgi:hypothetical protein